MKTYLPYFVRKIGILIFVIGATISFIGDIDDFVTSFQAGYKSGRTIYNDGERNRDITPELLMQERIENNELIFTPEEQHKWTLLGFLISLTGIMLYIFSKEKVEDEFASHLRGKSMLISVGITWLIFLLFKLPNWNTEISALSILQIQMIVFVIVYAYQRKWEHWG
jgi:uncharacterized membrane protein